MLRNLNLILVLACIVACDGEDPSVQTPTQSQPQRDVMIAANDMGMTPFERDGDATASQDESDNVVIPLDQGMQSDAGMGNQSNDPEGMSNQDDPNQGNPDAPGIGELVINEIMYDPKGLMDGVAEWVELKNVSGRELRLDGCRFIDRNGLETEATGGLDLSGATVPSQGFLLLARTEMFERNGGLMPDLIFDFDLGNDGDGLYILCGDVQIDVVTYDDGETFPNAKGFSIIKNDLDRWCPSTSSYSETHEERGTPGMPNDMCEPLEQPACWAQVDCVADQICRSGVCGDIPGGCQQDMDCDSNEVCENEECIVAPMGCGGGPSCQDTERCESGECVSSPRSAPPTVGQLIISEFMYDPDGLFDRNAEWIELANLTDAPLDVDGCSVGDASDETVMLTGIIPANGFLLLARSEDLSENGNLQVAGTFGFSLNQDGDALVLACGDTELDRAVYTDPTEPGVAYQRSSTDFSEPTDGETIWCPATNIYVETPQNLGTPGAANVPCSE